MSWANDLPHMTMEEVVTAWPATIEVFVTLNLACIGCSFAPFCTVEETALLYHLDLEAFLTRLKRHIFVETPHDGNLPDSSN